MPRSTKGPRNPLLAKGVRKFSRSAAYHNSGQWAVKNKVVKAPAKSEAAKGKTKPFGKGGKETRVVKPKATRFYPTQNVQRPLYSRKNARPASVRASLKAGTVLIILTGRFRGKRVVLLKTLPSGLLLVTGPYKINGVPLRRVNPAFVIATSTHLNLTGVDVSKFNDEYFRRPANKEKKEKSAEAFLEGKPAEAKKVIDPKKKTDQKAVDAPLLAAVKKVPQLVEYLNAKFSLSKNQFPHEMKF